MEKNHRKNFNFLKRENLFENPISCSKTEGNKFDLAQIFKNKILFFKLKQKNINFTQVSTFTDCQ
jgi:hypothetical protein